MPGLRIVVLTADVERFRGALTMAAAQAALGEPVAMLLLHDAVTLLSGVSAPGDERHSAHGLPTLAELIADALELGVEITACESGLDLAGISAEGLDPKVGVSGPLAFLQRRKDGEQLVLV